MIIDMDRRGFTIAELIIVITIMGVLLTLGVINLRGQQSFARDAERKIDVESITQHLETYYTSGSDDSTNFGIYPSIDLTASTDNITTFLRDIDLKSATAPTTTTENSDGSSLISATCSGTCVQTPLGVDPEPTLDTYVYQPLNSDGTLCTTTSNCVKFNLFYKLENATAECTEGNNNICMVTSRHQ